MTFLAPAKINLSLKITGKDKNDGYHFIKSVFDPVSIYDFIDINVLDSRGIRVKDAFGRLKIKQKKNLVYKAAVLLQKDSKTRQGADITLYKHIPDGAGLGGGSSDAAAVLKGLNKLWSLKYSVNRLKKLAFKLGSDVPFFIQAKPSMISGKGEIIRPFNRKRIFWYVIVVKKGIKVSTPDAYKWYDSDLKLTLSQNSNIIMSGLMRDQKIPLLHFSLFNDFEAPVYRREKDLKKVKDTLIKYGKPAGASLSGSGSSVFALFGKEENAHACYRKMKSIYKGSFVCIAHSI